MLLKMARLHSFYLSNIPFREWNAYLLYPFIYLLMDTSVASVSWLLAIVNNALMKHRCAYIFMN